MMRRCSYARAWSMAYFRHPRPTQHLVGTGAPRHGHRSCPFSDTGARATTRHCFVDILQARTHTIVRPARSCLVFPGVCALRAQLCASQSLCKRHWQPVRQPARPGMCRCRRREPCVISAALTAPSAAVACLRTMAVAMMAAQRWCTVAAAFGNKRAPVRHAAGLPRSVCCADRSQRLAGSMEWCHGAARARHMHFTPPPGAQAATRACAADRQSWQTHNEAASHVGGFGWHRGVYCMHEAQAFTKVWTCRAFEHGGHMHCAGTSIILDPATHSRLRRALPSWCTAQCKQHSPARLHK